MTVPTLKTGRLWALRLVFTSVASPFVTGSIALLWPSFQKAIAAQIISSIRIVTLHLRRTSVPPLFNAEQILKMLENGVRQITFSNVVF
jgi:hypothetical protein